MFTTTVSRTDLSVEEVAEALRRGLGSEYHVLEGAAVNLNPVGRPRSGQPNEIVVGRGSNRLFRAQVSVSRRDEDTTLHVRAGGLTLVPWLINRLWVARCVRRVLDDAFSAR
ncbi:MAG: hypothetical protein ACRDL5_12480 [Solirubrobacteraceae bacterium]